MVRYFWRQLLASSRADVISRIVIAHLRTRVSSDRRSLWLYHVRKRWRKQLRQKLRSLKPWSNESASHRKLTYHDLRWHQSNGVTSSHKFWTFAKYSLTFLRWCISYDSPLKRCLKDTFLLSIWTYVFPSLTISFFFHLALAGLVFLLSLWVLLWFKTTSTPSEAIQILMTTANSNDLTLITTWISYQGRIFICYDFFLKRKWNEN